MQQIRITTSGIKKALKKYKSCHAIAEYVWNGFDAKASLVEINYDSNDIGTVLGLEIKDNGYGINHKKLAQKFTPFLESEKEIDPSTARMTSDVHGKNGVGRLTFFTFASTAKWVTVYEESGKRFSYEITISAKELNNYVATEPIETKEETGTTVYLTGLYDLTTYNLKQDICDYLKREFGWFLELNLVKDYLIKVNGEVLDYEELVGERSQVQFEINGSHFDVRYVQWTHSLNKEYSRYYFIDSKNNEKYTDTTTLNNKADHFFHSLFVKSDFFKNFNGEHFFSDPLFRRTPEAKTYNGLMLRIEEYLKEKRKPFLKTNVDKLIDDFEKNKAFPNFSKNGWDKYRKDELKEFIGELYQVEPKIFSNMNLEQKKTFAHLLNLVMDTGERDDLLTIIDQIVNLSADDRKHLAETLKVTTLSNVIKTIKLIEDRYKTVAELKELLFKPKLKANELNHLQKVIEKHYWIFGEQYHLVTAAEPKFEEALRRFIYLLRGEKTNGKINHSDKLKEMDIFMVRQQIVNGDDLIKNVCVELKSPTVKLGEAELSKLKKYKNVISNVDDFNGSNMHWEFYLIGNSFDTSNHIENEIKNAKHHGEKSLVYLVENCKIYVKTWSEVLADFELKHNFLYEKLKLEREKLISDSTTANEIVENLSNNSATRPDQIKIPV